MEVSWHSTRTKKYTSHSSLSESVHHLICGLNEEFKELLMKGNGDNLKKDLLDHSVSGIHDGEISTFKASTLKNGVGSSDGTFSYEKATKELLPICHSIHNKIMQMTYVELHESYGMDLEWTGCKERMLECFAYLKSDDLTSVILCLLVLTSTLERSLGDVYLVYSGATQCPSHMKDLLARKELVEVCGEDIIDCLHILIGPPCSLNLRNVAWHGFVAPSEIPPQYISFLLHLMASLSKRLSTKPFASIEIKRRPVISFPLESLLTDAFPKLAPDDFPSIRLLFSRTYFVIPSMLPVWQKALNFFQEQRYDLATVLLLPQLEHALRRVFARVNKCPQRALTAESTSLYTTFDEILAPALPDGSENALRQEIGDMYLEILLDILVHPEGPRVRDHISHGEINLSNFPQQLANHIVCICVAFAALCIHDNCKEKLSDAADCTHNEECFTLEKTSVMKTCKTNTEHGLVHSGEGRAKAVVSLPAEEWKDLRSNGKCSKSYPLHVQAMFPEFYVIKKITTAAQSYQSIYHPVQILKRNIKDLCESFGKWEHLLKPDDKEFGTWPGHIADLENKETTPVGTLEVMLSNSGILASGCPIGSLLMSTDQELFCKGVGMALEGKTPTLYRPKSELEIVSLLTSIVQQCMATSAQVTSAADQRYRQWKKKELRSRQRANYKRLWIHLPVFLSVLKLMVSAIVADLPVLPVNAVNGVKSSYLRFLKRCLQCVENMKSLTNTAKNRWDECQVVGKNLTEIIRQHYSRKQN